MEIFKYPLPNHSSMVKVNNLVKLHILIALANGKSHGYELMKEVEGRTGKSISASHVYPFLKELEQEQYITIKETADREKKVYALTAAGRKLAKEVLGRVDDVISFALKSKLITCAHCGCRVYSGEHIEKVKGKELGFCCCHCADSYKTGGHHHH